MLVLIPKFNRSIKRLPTVTLILFLLTVSPNVLSMASGILYNSESHYLILKSIIGLNESFTATGRLIALILSSCLLAMQIVITATISPRVPEIAARFFLDSLPGRQMAVEVKEFSGAILPEDAMRQKADLQRTCDFLSAMDGVSKLISQHIRLYSAGLLIVTLLRVLGLFKRIPRLINADSRLLLQTGIVNLLLPSSSR